MKALIVLDCQKGMLARGNFDLLRENVLKLQEMFKASGDLIIHTRHIDENEESIIYNGDERGALDEELSADADLLTAFHAELFLHDRAEIILMAQDIPHNRLNVLENQPFQYLDADERISCTFSNTSSSIMRSCVLRKIARFSMGFSRCFLSQMELV